MNNAQRIREADSLAGIETLVFDLDGTLVDSAPGIGISLKVAFEAVGLVMPCGDLPSLVGPPINIIARRLEPSLTAEEVKAIEKEYRADYDKNGWHATVAFDGVVEGLLRLHRSGLRLFVVTNKPMMPTGKILEHFGVNAAFEAVLTRDSRTPKYASKIEMLAELIKNHGIEAASSAMVGDTSEDQEAARHNGVRFVYVTYGYGSILETDLQIDKFQAIEELLGQGDREQ